MQGEDLRNARKALGLNQTELGKLLGLSAQHISETENNKWKVDNRTALAMEALAIRKAKGLPLDNAT